MIRIIITILFQDLPAQPHCAYVPTISPNVAMATIYVEKKRYICSGTWTDIERKRTCIDNRWKQMWRETPLDLPSPTSSSGIFISTAGYYINGNRESSQKKRQRKVNVKNEQPRIIWMSEYQADSVRLMAKEECLSHQSEVACFSERSLHRMPNYSKLWSHPNNNPGSAFHFLFYEKGRNWRCGLVGPTAFLERLKRKKKESDLWFHLPVKGVQR